MISGAMTTWMLAVWLAAAPAEARTHAITGVVTNQNGDPMPRATVKLDPGNVEVVTDRDGKFEFVYLRDDTGGRIKLEKRVTYRLEVFKTGFHVVALEVSYKRGTHEVEPVLMVPETLKVQDLMVPLPGSEAVTQSGGNNKEWD